MLKSLNHIKAKPLQVTKLKEKKGDEDGVNELLVRKFSVERLRMTLAKIIIVMNCLLGLLSMIGSLNLWQR